jgi:hypothetical protein
MNPNLKLPVTPRKGNPNREPDRILLPLFVTAAESLQKEQSRRQYECARVFVTAAERACRARVFVTAAERACRAVVFVTTGTKNAVCTFHGKAHA